MAPMNPEPPSGYVFTHRIYERPSRYVACEVVSGEIPPGNLTEDWGLVDCPRCRQRAPACHGSLLARVPAEFMALAVALTNRIMARPDCPSDVRDMVEDIRLAAGGFGLRNDWRRYAAVPDEPGITHLWSAFMALPGRADGFIDLRSITLYDDGSGTLNDPRADDEPQWGTLAEGVAVLRAKRKT